jgi:hypothetical protein
MQQLVMIQQYYIEAEREIQHRKAHLRRTIQAKSQIFRQSFDIDVDIDYLQDKL